MALINFIPDSIYAKYYSLHGYFVNYVDNDKN